MSQIFNAIKGLITPELISKAAGAIGEDNSKVTSAIGSIVPGLLGSLLAKGNSTQVENVLKQAGDSHGDILSSIGSLFGGEDHPASGIGGTFLNAILGNKLGGFSSLISKVSGVSEGGVGKLLGMVSPLVAGFLGNKMKTGGLNLAGLLGSLNAEKSGFMNMLPAGLGGVLGLSSMNDLGKGLDKVTDSVSKAAKGGMGWMKWVLILAAIALACLWLWRSCGKKAVDKVENTVENVAGAVETGVEKAGQAIDSLMADIKLPDGTILHAKTHGIENSMVMFLNSDDYKNATAEQLKDKWFDFDGIDFKMGSATELEEGSQTQLDNLVAILKQYPTAKIKIGGYTDKTGSSEANLKLSQARANTIKAAFEKAGIGAQVVGAEGYGDKFAKVAPEASDEERAADRKISLRFVK